MGNSYEFIKVNAVGEDQYVVELNKYCGSGWEVYEKNSGYVSGGVTESGRPLEGVIHYTVIFRKEIIYKPKYGFNEIKFK